ncbi:ABC transporter permease [Georgenia sp. TF02-10]|uniref:ABC transporter permease n=1 Tax=Georgenia sp. TF02-10 TaxID=2917725 RepID=UPI001FA808C9|nr:ABC transporter permease [Georgenia sp. TF02-10]UNX53740.1 ABC transporter permease [Georgenia sp. TF02-10]
MTQLQPVEASPAAPPPGPDRPASPRTGRARARQIWAGSWRSLTFLVLALALWWLVTAQGWVKPYVLPSPGDTWSTGAEHWAYLMDHTWVTTYETVLGFLIAFVVGELVAILMVYSKNLELTAYPIILVAQVIPKIAVAPLFVVWLGFGVAPKVTIAVLMAFFPIVVSGLAGLRSVDPETLDLAKTMGASRFNTFRKIQFPASLPQLLSGLKVAATLAVTGAVVGEFVGGNEGLGYVILQANGTMDTAMLFAALVIMSVLGILLFAVIQLAEHLLIPWHASRRGAAGAAVIGQA